MKKEMLFTLLLLSLIMLSTMTSSASATDHTKVGVRVGDTADYTYSVLTGIEGFNIEILQIAGTNVTINIRFMYANNSQGPNNIFFGNVSSGDNQMFMFLILANLSQGYVTNSYNINGPTTMIVDGTTTMIIAGQNRTVNHLHLYPEFIIPPDAPINPQQITAGPCIENYTLSYDSYYDKITGLLVKANMTLTEYVAGEKVEGTWLQTLTSTTAFNDLPLTDNANALPVTAVALAVVAVIMVAAAITQRKKQ